MQKFDFEKSMERLEQIVRTLEQGDAKLEDSLKLFQEGTELVRTCGKMLNDAQLHIQKVLADTDGNPVMEDVTNEQIV